LEKKGPIRQHGGTRDAAPGSSAGWVGVWPNDHKVPMQWFRGGWFYFSIRGLGNHHTSGHIHNRGRRRASRELHGLVLLYWFSFFARFADKTGVYGKSRSVVYGQSASIGPCAPRRLGAVPCAKHAPHAHVCLCLFVALFDCVFFEVSVRVYFFFFFVFFLRF